MKAISSFKGGTADLSGSERVSC